MRVVFHQLESAFPESLFTLDDWEQVQTWSDNIAGNMSPSLLDPGKC